MAIDSLALCLNSPLWVSSLGIQEAQLTSVRQIMFSPSASGSRLQTFRRPAKQPEIPTPAKVQLRRRRPTSSGRTSTASRSSRRHSSRHNSSPAVCSTTRSRRRLPRQPAVLNSPGRRPTWWWWPAFSLNRCSFIKLLW